jgi:hypothetical protein
VTSNGKGLPQFLRPGERTSSSTFLSGIDFACCARVTIWTRLSMESIRGQGFYSTSGHLREYLMGPRGQKNARPRGREATFMATRIADRAIITIQVISRAAIIIAIGMISTVIAASIYESFRTLH